MIYANTASVGLPPPRVVQAVSEDVARWASGRAPAPSYDGPLEASRAAFARLLHVTPDAVIAGSQVSTGIGTLLGAFAPGARVVCVRGDFTSVLFPLVARGLDLVEVELGDVPDAVDATTALVALSAVQSADGRVADLDAIADSCRHHGAFTILDATQAAGWLEIDASRFDAVAAATYKWLLAPRGAALTTISGRLLERVPPVSAGWFAGADRWDALYGSTMQLSESARRLDVSPAWLAWVGLEASLELVEERTVAAIGAHDIGLADRLRAGLGLPAGHSAIVALDLDDAAARRLSDADVMASTRAGRTRLSFHLHNTEDEVDRLLDLIAG